MLQYNYIYINSVMVPRYKYTLNTVNVRAQSLFDSNNMSETNFKFAGVTA